MAFGKSETVPGISDKDWLYEQYVVNDLTGSQIAERFAGSEFQPLLDRYRIKQ